MSQKMRLGVICPICRDWYSENEEHDPCPALVKERDLRENLRKLANKTDGDVDVLIAFADYLAHKIKLPGA